MQLYLFYNTAMFDHGGFSISCKSSIVIPLIKKTGLDREIRPVSHLYFVSKVIEKVISIRILVNNIIDRHNRWQRQCIIFNSRFVRCHRHDYPC